MRTDPIEDLLRQADDAAPHLELLPPRLEDLEDKRRRRLVRRGAVLALVAVLITSALSISTWRAGHRERLWESATADLSRTIGHLEETLSSLGADPAPAPSAASEEAAMATFRALHRGADRGDEPSIDGMRWLARRFSATRGGRCAQLFLNDRGGRVIDPLDVPSPNSTTR